MEDKKKGWEGRERERAQGELREQMCDRTKSYGYDLLRCMVDSESERGNEKERLSGVLLFRGGMVESGLGICICLPQIFTFKYPGRGNGVEYPKYNNHSIQQRPGRVTFSHH